MEFSFERQQSMTPVLVLAHDQLDASGQSVGAALTARAQLRDKDLIVMGGYARSRIQQFILDGGSRDQDKARATRIVKPRLRLADARTILVKVFAEEAARICGADQAPRCLPEWRQKRRRRAHP